MGGMDLYNGISEISTKLKYYSRQCFIKRKELLIVLPLRKKETRKAILFFRPTGVLPHRLRFIFIHSDKPIDLIKRQTRIHLFK